MVDKLWRKGKPTLLVVMLIASSSMENSMEVLKLKTATLSEKDTQGLQTQRQQAHPRHQRSKSQSQHLDFRASHAQEKRLNRAASRQNKLTIINQRKVRTYA